MDKYRAIPPGYMTAGEAAKKMGVTVRTLQYYDKAGLLPPSAHSAGGRRLYSDRDLIRLHQILSLKSLGFSLEDIQERLMPLDTPQDVAAALGEQADTLRQKIEQLTDALQATEQLRGEVLQMQTVDFKKYADIIVNLQMKNEFYFLIKHFDDDMLEHIRTQFDAESGLAFIRRFSELSDEIFSLQKAGVPQSSAQCQKLVGEFWGMVMRFTGGDMTLLPKLAKLGAVGDGAWVEKQAAVNAYIGPALEIYFSNLGVDPFGEETK